MPIIKRGPVALNYQVTGHGAPLVLIGGLGMPLQGWGFQVKTLSKHFQLVRLDNRGCGGSSTPGEPFAIQDMAEDVFFLMDHLGLASVHVLGLSMGGFIALEMAVASPKRIKSLCLAHTAAKVPALVKQRLRLWQRMKQERVSKTIMAWEQLLWIFPEAAMKNDKTVDGMVQNLIMGMKAQSSEGFKCQADACEGFDIIDRLEMISTPALIISSEDDISISPAGTKTLEGLAGVKKVKIFSAAGHISHLIHPREFNQEVLEFIQSIDP